MLKTNYFNIKFQTEYVTILTVVLRIKAISKRFKTRTIMHFIIYFRNYWVSQVDYLKSRCNNTNQEIRIIINKQLF